MIRSRRNKTDSDPGIGAQETGSKPRSRLRLADAAATGTHGLRSRRGRSLLTAVGIAIGIASMIAVLGISSSSKADLIAQIDRLGTNLLEVRAGNDVFGEAAKLPVESPAMVRRVGAVEGASAVSKLATKVQRNDLTEGANGLHVLVAEPDLIDTLEGSVTTGRFLDEETSRLPVVVLGSVAAERLGITSLDGAPTVDIGGRRFAVTGLLASFPLNPDLDRSVLIGNGAATDVLGAEVIPTSLYLRADLDHLKAVRDVLPRTVNPGDPNEVSVSRPSDALEARAQVDEGLQNLLLGLGAVALLVGGVGIANVMVISVLERRGEVGLRRALGATRSHIAVQFILESVALAALGGLIGVVLGVGVTVGYARRQDWLVDIPAAGLGLGIAAALALGAVAGLYPAVRAARLDPAEAVRPQ